MGEAVASEDVADDRFDALLAEPLPVRSGVPHIDIAEAVVLDGEVDDEPLRWSFAEPCSDLAVDLFVGGNILDERVGHGAPPRIQIQLFVSDIGVCIE